jgi:hypothetical protein
MGGLRRERKEIGKAKGSTFEENAAGPFWREN